jgi:hypothetical protein
MMMSTHSSLLFLGGGNNSVATLALGSRPKQRACKVANQEGSLGVTSHALGVKSVKEWMLRFPRQLPLWEMESRWTPKFSKGDCRGQNSMACHCPLITTSKFKEMTTTMSTIHGGCLHRSRRWVLKKKITMMDATHCHCPPRAETKFKQMMMTTNCARGCHLPGGSRWVLEKKDNDDELHSSSLSS